jgi:hypothetical protein
MMPKLPLKPGLVRQLENACRNTDARHRDISKQYGVSLGCLHDYAMRIGWRLPTGPQNPRYSAEVWAGIESLCRTTTEGYRAIGGRFGMSDTRVHEKAVGWRSAVHVRRDGNEGHQNGQEADHPRRHLRARPGDRRSRRPLRPDRLAHLDIGDIGEFASSPSTTTGSGLATNPPDLAITSAHRQ